MKHIGNVAMGPNGVSIFGLAEITLPYKENRNEAEVEIDRDYRGPMPKWEIWDWMEVAIPDMHDETNGGVAWWKTNTVFSFFFRDRRKAALFHLRFGGELHVSSLPE